MVENQLYTIFHVLYISVQLNYVLYTFRARRLHNNNDNRMTMSLYQYEVPELMEESESRSYYEMIPTTSHQNVYSLDMILKHLKAFEYLVNFMCKEHCYEYLLFLTEINQFKQRMLRDHFIPMMIRKIAISDMRNSLVQMSNDIPRSSLVYEDEDINKDDPLRTFRIIIHRLYEKYIKNESELAIKTTFVLRKRFDFWMEDGNKWKNGNVVLSLNASSTLSPIMQDVNGSLGGSMSGSMSVDRSDADAFKLFYIFEEHLKICKSFCLASFERFRDSEEYEELESLVLIK